MEKFQASVSLAPMGTHHPLGLQGDTGSRVLMSACSLQSTYISNSLGHVKDVLVSIAAAVVLLSVLLFSELTPSDQ